MRTIFLLFSLLTLFVVGGCSDDDCVTCTETETPEVANYSLVGFWEAVESEGMVLADEGVYHSMTLRRDGTYREYDSAGTVTVTSGRYQFCGDSLMLSPTSGLSSCDAVWACVVEADSMTLCYCLSDHTPAWRFVRSTAD